MAGGIELVVGVLKVMGRAGIREAEHVAVEQGTSQTVAVGVGAFCEFSVNAGGEAVLNAVDTPPDSPLSSVEQNLVPALAEVGLAYMLGEGMVALGASAGAVASLPVTLGTGAVAVLVVGHKKQDIYNFYEGFKKMPGDALKLAVSFFKAIFHFPIECIVHEQVWGGWWIGYQKNPQPRGTFKRRDPLIIDLDRDGINTLGTDAGVYFDHDADGFAEKTGWASPPDGFLVMDRNGDGIINDGREMFGDQTALQNGNKATNGFQALTELDGNKDGKIDANDAGYFHLKVWQDADSNGLSAPDELHSLYELGIATIQVDSTGGILTDSQGNTQTRWGVIERVDGSAGQIGEFQLQSNSALTLVNEWFSVPDDIAGLPDLAGGGIVHNLHQAMVRDSTGQLKFLLEQFANAGDPISRNALMGQILYKWTGSDSIEPSSRGPNIDARQLAVLEKFMGRPFKEGDNPTPSYEASIGLKEIYRQLFEYFYAGLMHQTHLESVWRKIYYTWNEQSGIEANFSLAAQDITEALANNAEDGKQLLGEFARTMRGFGAQRTSSYLALREAFIQQDPSLGWVIDSGGLPVYEHLGQGIRGWRPHIEGTDNADAVRGSLTEGDGYLNGLNGNDVIYGTSRGEILYNEAGDALLSGEGGNDWLWAGEGNDILDGGTGNDWLSGEVGNDTYIFRRGSGQDIIIDPDPTADNADTIWLGSNLTPDEIVLRRSGNNLVLKIIDTTDTLTVQDYFRNDSPLNRIEQIQFMDGTVWTHDDLHGVAA